MDMLKIRILILVCALGFFLSCKKSNDSSNLKSDAVLTWTGDYAVDGCGFFITINEHKYKPENESIIDSNFKSGSSNVIVEYQLSNRKIETACGDLPTSTMIDGIKIISIKKK